MEYSGGVKLLALITSNLHCGGGTHLTLYSLANPLRNKVIVFIHLNRFSDPVVCLFKIPGVWSLALASLGEFSKTMHNLHHHTGTWGTSIDSIGRRFRMDGRSCLPPHLLFSLISQAHFALLCIWWHDRLSYSVLITSSKKSFQFSRRIIYFGCHMLRDDGINTD